MMSKSAVQKDRLPFQFEGAATFFGGFSPHKPKSSYVPACNTHSIVVIVIYLFIVMVLGFYSHML